jgi:hypothetical protein
MQVKGRAGQRRTIAGDSRRPGPERRWPQLLLIFPRGSSFRDDAFFPPRDAEARYAQKVIAERDRLQAVVAAAAD